MEVAFATLRVCSGLMDASYYWDEEDQGRGDTDKLTSAGPLS